jgi:hypothetical protein
VSFADINDPATTVSGLQPGDNILTWTVDNGSCGTTTDQVNIRLFSDAQPDADAGPDQQLCTPDSDADMAGSALTYPATGTWTLVSGTAPSPIPLHPPPPSPAWP